MNIWNKVLVGFILVLSPVSLYLTIRAMRTHHHWRTQVVQMETDLQGTIERNAELIDGTSEGEGEGETASMGTRQAAMELHKMMVDRGRVWYNCQPLQVQDRPDPDTGLDTTIEGVKLATTLPEPNGISKDTVLFLFEHKETQQGARYLGQFTVEATNPPKELQLLPSMNLLPEQQKRLTDSQQSRTLWTLYETMPIDDHAAFAGMSEAKIKAFVGSDSVARYLANAERKFRDYEVLVRDYRGRGEQPPPYLELRDYEALFRDFHRQRSIGVDMTNAATRDKQFMDEATADATQQEQFRRNEIDQLKTELAEVTAEANAVIAHLDEVKNKLASVKAAAEKLIQENRAVAGEIARIQLEAARLIDERTRSMAQLTAPK